MWPAKYLREQKFLRAKFLKELKMASKETAQRSGVSASEEKQVSPPPPPQPKISEKEKVPMFTIAGSDPFVDGVVRHYMKVSKDPRIDPAARPFVLKMDDPAAVDCLMNYRQRAAGAGDKARAAIADEAIKKFGTVR